MALKIVGSQKVLDISNDLLLRVIMLARRLQRAFGTPFVIKHIALQINCLALEFLKPLGLEHLKHLLARNLVAHFQNFAFLFVEQDGGWTFF